MIRIDNRWDAYVAAPEKVQKGVALLYLPDVMGIWTNSQLMADQYAANGYTCVIPDIFNGDALSLNRPAGFDLKKWIGEGSDGKSPHNIATIDPIIEATINTIKGELGFTKIGAVGYCFGCKVGAAFIMPFYLFSSLWQWKVKIGRLMMRVPEYSELSS